MPRNCWRWTMSTAPGRRRQPCRRRFLGYRGNLPLAKVRDELVNIAEGVVPIRKGRLARLSVFEHRFSEERRFPDHGSSGSDRAPADRSFADRCGAGTESEGGGLGMGGGGMMSARHGQPADPDHRDPGGGLHADQPGPGDHGGRANRPRSIIDQMPPQQPAAPPKAPPAAPARSGFSVAPRTGSGSWEAADRPPLSFQA